MLYSVSRRGRAHALCAAALMLASCRSAVVGSSATVPSPTVDGVAVACSPISIQAGQTSACTATVTGAGSYSSAVDWTTTCGSITGAGVLSLPTACTATVAATSRQDATKKGQASVTATTTPPPSTITRVTVACSPTSIQTGQTSTCTATVTGTGSYSSAVDWTTTCGSITAGGLLTLTAACAATVKATSHQDTSKLGTAVVTASSPPAGGGKLAAPYANIQLIGNTIFDTAGEPFVGRGVEMVSADSNVQGIGTYAGWGVNAVRLLFDIGASDNETLSSLDDKMNAATSHGMVVWISLIHFSEAIKAEFGGGNFHALTAPAGTGTCSTQTPTPCYLAVWDRQWLKDIVAKYSPYVILDAMQEYAPTVNPEAEAARAEWAAAAKTNLEFFRAAGYTQPLEFMSNYQGRDLYAIHEYGDEIRAVDTVKVGGYPQTMFGWQAYWDAAAAPDYYPAYQGGLFGVGSLRAPSAITRYAIQEGFPIEIGLDNYEGDSNTEYEAEIDAAASVGATWLWWSFRNGDIECPASGDDCRKNVKAAPGGFGGAIPISTTSATPWALPVNKVRVWPRAGYESFMVGGTLRGSNTSPTASLVTLATISSTPTSAGLTVTFANSTAYRYLVYVGPDGSYGDVSEIEFYSGNVRLTGTALGSTGFASAFDRDVTTAFHGPAASGSYVGLDLRTGP